MTNYPHTFTGRSRRYLRNLFLALDQLANAALGGDPDETISSRLGKWITRPRTEWRWKVAYVICRILHPIDRHHCAKSVESDEGDGGTWA